MSNSKPAFCSNCGAALAPGTAFCDQCGHRVAAASPSPSPSPAPAPEPAPAAPRSSSALLVVPVIIAAVIGVAAAMLWGRLKPSPPAATKPPDAVSVTPDKPATLADPVDPAVNPGRPPVEVAYIHFLDEAHRVTGGKIRVGSPTSTPTRIEVRVTTNGKPETVVVIEKFNNGRQATILVGPKDAGAFRSYTLVLGSGGWGIQSFEDLEG